MAVPPACLAGVSWASARVAVLIDVAVLGLFAVDVWRAEHAGRVIVRRVVPERVAAGKPFGSALEVENRTNRGVRVVVADRLPDSFEPRHALYALSIPPHAHVNRERTVVATRRGAHEVRPASAEVQTPLGLGAVRVAPAEARRVVVLPSTSDFGRFDALVRQARLREMGVARVRERGEGTEIAGLRPYALGDPYARIDWKATARRAALVTREMHAERRQTVLLLLDCGRRMAREAEGRSRLDHAVSAALLLAHVALRSDDRVGLVAFADRVLRVVKPVRGHASARVLAEAIYALEPVLLEPPYHTIAAQVARHFPRRSLVILFTDAVEPASLESLARPVRFLGQRHLVVCAVFRDASVEGALRDPPADADAFFRAGAASELLVERDQGLERLRRAGALVVETTASTLSTDVVNRYLEVKARRFL